MQLDKIKDDLLFNEIRAQMRKDNMKDEAQMLGYQQALIRYYKQIAYDYILDHKEDYEYTLFPKIQKWYKTYEKNSKSRHKYILITINPFTDVTINELLKAYRKAMKKKYIVSSLSCLEWTQYEQRTNKFHNGNLHIHIRLEISNKDSYRVREEFYNTFKNLTEKQCVTARYSNTKDSFIRYINGYQKDKTGQYQLKDCIPITKYYRSHYDIPPTF